MFFKKHMKVIVTIGLVVLIGIAFAMFLNLYTVENESRASAFTSGDETAADQVAVDVSVLSIDPVKGELVARLNFDPQGAYLSDDGVDAGQNMILDVNGASGKVAVTYKKGERMSPVDVTVSLYNGNVMDYPFDLHDTDLSINLNTFTGGKDGEEISYEAVPMTINYFGAVSGYQIAANEDTASTETGFIDIVMQVKRSTSVMIFSIFVMVLQWLLCLVALSVAFSCIIWGRKIEVGMFGWMGALLFALIPLRNAMPGVPAIGTLSDFIAFFWAEAIVALSLVAIVISWVARPQQK
jgi:hypothetical protein